MIRVSVLYPNGAGTKFDMAYYTSKHMPMVQKLCGAACRSIAAERGVGGGEPGSKPTYIAAGHLTFDSVEAFQKAFGPNAAQILGDIPNYTNAQPIVQISEITL
ncbi:MAG TPA: EthD family reductase [Steroidobacteraceae bacterium]|nr:EthD family reductase [Steroidobacteraceae bacterium]